MADNKWTPEIMQTLEALWTKGHSCAVIASEINHRYGTTFSRNAVIGKRTRTAHLSDRGQGAHRPRAAYTAQAVSQTSTATPDRKVVPRPPRVPFVEVTPEEGAIYDKQRAAAGLVSLIDIEPLQCRWPIGDPRDDTFGLCAAHQIIGKAYCAHHARRAESQIPSAKRQQYQPTRFKSKEFA